MSIKNKTYHCINCGKNIPFKGYSYNHKYCDNQCQADYRSKQADERNRIKLAEGTLKGRRAIAKLLAEERGYQCECCGLSSWQGKEIVLQVDHINGDPYNHTPSNLRLICPNCHSQTDTFAGANRGNGRWSKENLARYYTKGPVA